MRSLASRRAPAALPRPGTQPCTFVVPCGPLTGGILPFGRCPRNRVKPTIAPGRSIVLVVSVRVVLLGPVSDLSPIICTKLDAGRSDPSSGRRVATVPEEWGHIRINSSTGLVDVEGLVPSGHS